MSDQDIIKDGNLIIVTTTSTTQEVFNLDELRGELQSLESDTPPTTEEIVTAMENGEILPYYSLSRKHRIDYLREKVAELESI